jgi:hypothetical protein
MAMVLILTVDNVEQEHGVQVLQEAMECHVEGLKASRDEATTDRTIEEPEDLVNVTRSMDNDLEAAQKILEVINVYAHS